MKKKIKQTKDSKRTTEKQKKLLLIISENLGTRRSSKTMYQMMLEAGYSNKTALQQSEILCRLEEELKPIVNQLDKKRQKMINKLDKTINKATFRDLTDGIDKMTKNIQLLSGGATDRIVITDKEKAAVDKAFNQNT